jgi:hypothetical protein
MNLVLKYAISALLVVAVAEISKRSSLIGALLASLPTLSILAMIWLWRDTHDAARIAKFSTGVFWLVLPSLVLFVLLPPLLLKWKFSFPVALAMGCAATAAAYGVMVFILKRCGVDI